MEKYRNYKCGKTHKLKVWKSTETRNVEKYRNQKCGKIQKLEMWKSTEMGKITETRNVEKYRNQKCGKVQKLEMWKVQKFEMWKSTEVKKCGKVQRLEMLKSSETRNVENKFQIKMFSFYCHILKKCLFMTLLQIQIFIFQFLVKIILSKFLYLV